MCQCFTHTQGILGVYGPFAPQKPFHSTQTNCGTTHFLFAPQELGTVLVPGTPFGGTKLAPTSEYGLKQFLRNYLL